MKPQEREARVGNLKEDTTFTAAIPTQMSETAPSQPSQHTAPRSMGNIYEEDSAVYCVRELLKQTKTQQSGVLPVKGNNSFEMKHENEFNWPLYFQSPQQNSIIQISMLLAAELLFFCSLIVQFQQAAN